MLPKNTIEKIFRVFKDLNPNPKTELEYKNTFQLLVAVILSAQSSDKMVNRCLRDLFETCLHPQQIIDIGLEELTSRVKTIGLYRNKAKNILKTCQRLVSDHKGEVPGNYKDLISLPGVGRKTADVILNVAFNKPTIPVDRHVFRVAHRMGIIGGRSVEEVSDGLIKVIPKKYKQDAHHWLVLHGRYVCKAQKPHCATCPVSKYCDSFQNRKI